MSDNTSFEKFEAWFKVITGLAIPIVVIWFIWFGGWKSCGSSKSKDNKTKTEQHDDKGISINGGVATIRYEMTPEDFVSSKETHWRWVGDRVLLALKNQTVTSIELIIIDSCKDQKGNISKYESKINFNSNIVREFRTYKDRDSFVYNCAEWTSAVFKWYRCGFDEVYQSMHY